MDSQKKHDWLSEGQHTIRQRPHYFARTVASVLAVFVVLASFIVLPPLIVLPFILVSSRIVCLPQCPKLLFSDSPGEGADMKMYESRSLFFIVASS